MSEHADKVLATVEAGNDTSAVAASWRRCRNLYGLDPDRRLAPERDLAGWREACKREARMIAVAQPYLDELFRLFQNPSCAVLVADRHGMMLDFRTGWERDSWGRPAEECLGTIYSERLIGTNSIGTCLAEERGVTLRGAAHFLAQYQKVVCVSAPISAPDGAIAGCLVTTQKVSAHDTRLDAFLSITVATFARRIETEMLARAFPTARVVLASPIGRQPGALLAVDPDDRVVGATRAARRLLDLPDAPINGVLHIGEMLEKPLPGELADVERRMIGRAMSRCGGNISAAAKAIGVSRSTLYRKMALYSVRRQDADDPCGL